MESLLKGVRKWAFGGDNVSEVEHERPIVSSRQQLEPYADITILLDKSGSMSSMRSDVIGGYNEVIKNMRKDNPGPNRWTMYQFDTPTYAGEQFPHPTFEQQLENDLKPLTEADYAPRGGTALIDACCKTIEAIDARVSGQDHIKPCVMIMTDGQENESHTHTNEDLRKLISDRTEKGWQFSYFGANQDSFAVARQYSMGGSTASHLGLAAGSTYENDWRGNVCSGAISSGMIGLYHMSSGAVQVHNSLNGANP